MPLPIPANTTCQIYRAGTSPAAAWDDPCADTDGTAITAHAPTVPPTGAYQYCVDNLGGIAVESNTLQGTDDGGDNRFFFDPGLPDPSSASIDFKYTNSGAFPVDSAGYSGYYLRLGVRYGNDAAGGDGFLAHLIFNGSNWVLTLYQFSSGATRLSQFRQPDAVARHLVHAQRWHGRRRQCLRRYRRPGLYQRPDYRPLCRQHPGHVLHGRRQ